MNLLNSISNFNRNFAEKIQTELNEDLFRQLGQDIIGTSTAFANFGWSISMNDAGDRMIIGAPNYLFQGRVGVYQYINSTWAQLGDWIDSEEDGMFSSAVGFAVSMNGVGNIIAISDPYYPPSSENHLGKVKVYSFDENSYTWNQMGGDIIGEFENESAYTIKKISINTSGDKLAIAFIGHVKVYSWNGSTWNQLGIDIDGDEIGDSFGESICLNNAGDRVIIGASSNDGIDGNPETERAGQVKIYSWNGSTWTQLGSSLFGQNYHNEFGWSVSMNAVGDRIVIGEPFEGGCVKIYSWDTDDWSLLANFTDDTTQDTSLGFSVSINAIGDRVVAGAPAYDEGANTDAGFVRVYSTNSNDFTPESLLRNFYFYSPSEGNDGYDPDHYNRYYSPNNWFHNSSFKIPINSIPDANSKVIMSGEEAVTVNIDDPAWVTPLSINTLAVQDINGICFYSTTDNHFNGVIIGNSYFDGIIVDY